MNIFHFPVYLFITKQNACTEDLMALNIQLKGTCLFKDFKKHTKLKKNKLKLR